MLMNNSVALNNVTHLYLDWKCIQPVVYRVKKFIVELIIIIFFFHNKPLEYIYEEVRESI